MVAIKYIQKSFSVSGLLIGLMLIVGLSPLSAQQASALKGHDTGQALDVTANEIRLKQKKGQAFMTGSVEVSQGELMLTANQIVVFYDINAGFDNPSVQRLDATGGVKLTSPSETISSEWAVYDVVKRIVTLGGKVAYNGIDAAISGDRLELNLSTGLVKLDGQLTDGEQRVTGRFSVPKKEKQ
jgi:lipopolysaccharide export system protein LptA